LKKILSIIITLILFTSVSVFAGDTYVRGYTRSDGTYVAPYYRTSPDHTIDNNYSTKGNYNYHTGEQGTVNPNYGDSNSNQYNRFNNGYNLNNNYNKWNNE
jgi:hypothetical protein